MPRFKVGDCVRWSNTKVNIYTVAFIEEILINGYRNLYRYRFVINPTNTPAIGQCHKYDMKYIDSTAELVTNQELIKKYKLELL